eukprot:TRINITY_DN121384_c0_g1_i1.p1 TRINITY_DN121384_c0_g1~~TRINITY_DN121384_c0_g1_i1.p1  ORF type:complete len:223 (-),score=49.10 TRINITY_DN121384_c0_g1_i1:208-876(-)
MAAARSQAWTEGSPAQGAGIADVGKVSVTSVLQQIRDLVASSQTSVAIDVLDNLIDIDYVDTPLLEPEDWTVACKPMLVGGERNAEGTKERVSSNGRQLRKRFESNLGTLSSFSTATSRSLAWFKSERAKGKESKRCSGLFGVFPDSKKVGTDDLADRSQTASSDSFIPGLLVGPDEEDDTADFFNAVSQHIAMFSEDEDDEEPSIRRQRLDCLNLPGSSSP